jgi:hypothetical protein
VDLEYFFNDLRHKEHDVAIFIDTNQNDKRCYRPQGYDKQFESDGGFNIGGRIDGSLKTFMENMGLVNALKKKHDSGNVPPTRELMIFIEQDLILKKDRGAYNHV